MEVTVVAAAAVIVIVVYDQGLSERSPFVLMPREVEINWGKPYKSRKDA